MKLLADAGQRTEEEQALHKKRNRVDNIIC